MFSSCYVGFGEIFDAYYAHTLAANRFRGLVSYRSVMNDDTVLALAHVDIVRKDRVILRDISWTVRRNERWVVLGQNGSGKTTLCRLASLYLHPSRGTIDVFGERIGRTDVRELRTRVGFTSIALSEMLRTSLRVEDVVVTGKYAAFSPFWHTYTSVDRARAATLLHRFGCARFRETAFGKLSEGERQRVLLARTLMSDPALLVLDEPTAGLDLGGREQLVSLLATIAADATAPATLLVTHHVDEIPRGFTHVLLLADGQILDKGPIENTLTSGTLSRCFGVELSLERRNGRWLTWGIEDR